MKKEAADFVKKCANKALHIQPIETIYGQMWSHMDDSDKKAYKEGAFGKFAGAAGTVVFVGTGIGGWPLALTVVTHLSSVYLQSMVRTDSDERRKNAKLPHQGRKNFIKQLIIP